ncbi:MAG TPA: hypothetical protein VLF69_03285 [Candidatus Saccharimonadales bacterium]|nr:hypothetical protein [Candidatus Saccharimonadales bacterium]
MSVIKDRLHYHSSPYSVAEHVAEADAVLRACRKEFPKLLPYLLQPSNLLVLGGLRGESPYAKFGGQSKAVRSEEFAAFLRRFGLQLLLEEIHYGERSGERLYTLIHTGALEALPAQYHAVQDWWAPKPRGYDQLNYLDWYMHNLAQCVDALEGNKLPKGWLADWWAPHNICFGMLLGYPGTAICSASVASMVRQSLGVKPDLLEVSFAYPPNDGVQVVYDVQKADAGSKQIAAHQKRWQEFFDLIYANWSFS